MANRKRRQAFSVVCAGARSVIAAALCLAGFLASLQLAALLPEPWSAMGITTLLLFTGLPLLGRWPAREFRLESVGLGYQPDRPAYPLPTVPAATGRGWTRHPKLGAVEPGSCCRGTTEKSETAAMAPAPGPNNETAHWVPLTSPLAPRIRSFDTRST